MAPETESGMQRPGWERYRRLAGAGPAVLLALVAFWELAMAAIAGGGVPDEEAWRAASAELRARHQPGDLIVFAPGWLDPVGRQHLGDLIPIEMAARMDGARYGRIWELSARREHAPEVEELEPVDTEDFGDLELSLYERAPAEVVTDFVEAFASAEVAGASARAPAVRLEEVGFAPHRCVRLVPRPDQTVTVTYPAAELGRELVGYVGLADVFTRRDVRAPGRLVVRVDGEEVASVTAGVDDGWVRFAAPIEPGAGEVSFAATAVGPEARDRRICFAAEARR